MEWVLIAWPTLILLGLGLRMVIHVHYGARGPNADDPIYIFLSTASWVLIVLGMIPAIVGGAITYVGLIIVLIALATMVEAVLERRAAQRRSMCTLLYLLVEHGAQLKSSELLEGTSTRGIVGRAARKLLDSLDSGMPLAAAIYRNPAALPREAVAYVAAGRSTATESAALKELSRSDRSGLESIWRACVDRICYLSSVLMILAGVFTFLMIKIVPEFRKIFEEFDLQLPAITELAVAISAFAVNYLALPLTVLVPLLVLVAFVLVMCFLFDIPILRRLGDRVFRGRHSATVLRILAVSVEHRQSLVTALTRLAHVYPSAMLRRKLAVVADAATEGRDWRDAMFEGRFISRAEQSLLKTAEQVGNLGWALRSIASRKERRTMYRLAAAVQVLYPCVIVALGMMVGFFVVALFIPLVKLIENLA